MDIDDRILRGSGDAPAPRTLIDILSATAAAHPESSAIEDPAGALSYREMMTAVDLAAARLREAGVSRGDRVGVRLASGRRELYLSILAVLTAGAAYVPVDVDDPDERAALVFGEADVVGVVTGRGEFAPRRDGDRYRTATLFGPGRPPSPASAGERPGIHDDAWIIFTSGSTGTPKGVAVSHRSAAAFVDAESRMFLQDAPLGPSDRVLAGLSVAFDASCEEMWLAWGHGACLVPAPRDLVRSGVDLGPWLTTRRINVVSTVPTLAALWPAESLENVRLLIFGGEAVPPELAERLATDDRELWNTYGPTEATVVACGARLLPGEIVRIGLPLDGWELAVVDGGGIPVDEGEVGELVIGGVGLARYLDPAKDAEKYAPMATLGWDRAYRSGDLVRFDRSGLVFQGRADDQVKVGGRRIELGEVESALQALPGVSGAAAAVRTTAAGVQILVGYLALADPGGFDRAAALERLRAELPAALVPVLAVVDDLPVRTSGKVDRAALPWPLTGQDDADESVDDDVRWLREQWQRVLGLPVTDDDANFFDLGGSSLAAAGLVALIRERDTEFAVAEIYAHPRFGAMLAYLRSRSAEPAAPIDMRPIRPVPRSAQVAQTVASVLIRTIEGVRWLVYLVTAGTLLAPLGGFAFLPTASWWLLVPALIVFVTPPGRMALAVIAARLLLRGVQPGDYPRGGSVHLRLWAAETIAEAVGAVSLAGAPWILYYARALGAKIGEDVDLHSLPPVTGMLSVGARASIEPEVDLSGYWLDGDVLRLGAVRIGADARVGARSTLLPGAHIGKRAEIAPGSAVFGRVRAGQSWAGSPAARVGSAEPWWPAEHPPRRSRWVLAYAAASIAVSLLPVIAFLAGGAVVAAAVRGADDLGSALGAALLALVPAVLVWGLTLAALVLAAVRLFGLGLREGVFPVRGRIGLQVWATERVLDLARTLLFPLYSGMFTSVWLRLLGARVGTDVEASTVLLIPAMTTIKDGAFLADDTMVAGYDLGGGFVRLAHAEIGKRAFVGNSGMAAAGHVVPRDGLVAVLSSAPVKSKAGSSWMGSPPVRLRRRAVDGDVERTYSPPIRLRVARAAWEAGRVLPVIVSAAIGLLAGAALAALASMSGLLAIACSGIVLIGAGALAAAVSSAAKWILIGRVRPGDHLLWSSFIWRSELADTFVEMVAAPWFAARAGGTPALVWWLRSLGARIGRGVWCETYWLPEADLVTLGAGASVNRGCVVQTHLFHDRVMTTDTATLDPGSTLGPHGVILPASRVGENATVGPASLVMRGETVPVGTRWSGNPIGPWRDVRVAEYRTARPRTTKRR
ncbi:Pls/PosA family non-ribosomal peptide synthetase [Amnibacterium flavum]|uniref:Amino acid adenylation protein n=1 Tax=Amnibacterium flavum TaxID=2173173 RepID=A0A2V1HY36_9MICO|nr:Pls/PosA family non-ribosomal peptide synthetase [Amnibacterium flavum]PVZ96310.1 amino acid adenylation protein [Amnibacterium flavum]